MPTSIRISAIALIAVLAGRALALTPDELGDFDAKTEYAFLTEDAHALGVLVAASSALKDSAQPLERYQYAHAQFRLLQVAYHHQRVKDVEQAGAACLDALDRNGESAEGLALEAACAGYLGTFGGLKGLAAQHRSEARLAAARELEPKNPRVLLVAGLMRWYTGGTASRADARRNFEAAAHAFDTVTETEPGRPTWGEAEAWLFVGRALEEGGDLLGARNAYEKSLLVAPEFAAARRRVAALRR